MQWMNGRRWLAALAVTGVVAVLAGGCSGAGSADKAGGSGEPVVLHLANFAGGLDQIPAVEYFVSQVKQRSGGNLRIQVASTWGDYAPDVEQQVVRAVAAGRVDLGWVGTRALDTLGVTSFQALQAPMLIDSYALEQAVLASDIPGQMLSGLGRIGVDALAVLADGLHKPYGVKRPVVGVADWRGITFGTYSSQVQAQAIRSLGATPTPVIGTRRDQALKDGRIQGFALDLFRYKLNTEEVFAPYVTANVNLWPQINVLLANPGQLGALTDQQRGWLRQAAQDAAGRSAALVDHDAEALRFVCDSGARFANASQADLTALDKAFAPVYASLEQDPQTKAFIQRIQALKRSTPAGPPLAIPAGCSGPAPTRPAAPQAPAASDLNGTYRWTITKQDALANKLKDQSPFPVTSTMKLKDGTWILTDRENGQLHIDGQGTYAFKGNRILFRWPPGPGISFTFSVDDKGNLHLTPIPPMAVDDQFVWSTKPWIKIA
jgi:TRAP-type C4-dicarboxylate transport system substrate-binding protein